MSGEQVASDLVLDNAQGARYDKMKRIRLEPEGRFKALVACGKGLEIVPIDEEKSSIQYRWYEKVQILEYRYEVVFTEDGGPEEDGSTLLWLPRGAHPMQWGECHVEYASGIGAGGPMFAHTTINSRIIVLEMGRCNHGRVTPVCDRDIRAGAHLVVTGWHKVY